MQYCTLVHTIKMNPAVIPNISSTQATPREFPEENGSSRAKLLKIPWLSSGWDSSLSLPRAQVRSLVRELRSYKLCGEDPPCPQISSRMVKGIVIIVTVTLLHSWVVGSVFHYCSACENPYTREHEATRGEEWEASPWASLQAVCSPRLYVPSLPRPCVGVTFTLIL